MNKIQIQKIIFPFYKSKTHHFLKEKIFFRLLIVLYPIGLLIYTYQNWLQQSYMSWGYCYKFIIDKPNYPFLLDKCSELRQTHYSSTLLLTLIATIFVHYIIQFVFFKIIINFVVLGGEKNKNAD